MNLKAETIKQVSKDEVFNFIHNHEKIRLNKITNLKNHENEMELFLIGKNLTYQMVLNIIK